MVRIDRNQFMRKEFGFFVSCMNKSKNENKNKNENKYKNKHKMTKMLVVVVRNTDYICR